MVSTARLPVRACHTIVLNHFHVWTACFWRAIGLLIVLSDSGEAVYARACNASDLIGDIHMAATDRVGTTVKFITNDLLAIRCRVVCLASSEADLARACKARTCAIRAATCTKATIDISASELLVT